MTQQAALAPEGLIGSVLLGRYRVVRELARGGMGVVYLARAEGAVGFVKPVVIKVLLPEHTEDEHMVRLFAREARILSQLRHPSLVDVIEFGEQNGGYVLVLEYVRGYHLGLWLRYLSLTRRDVPVQILLQLVIDVLDALHHAHTQVHPDGTSMHIVHRDVSPSNVLLDETGRGRLLDFGVARMRGASKHDYRTQVQGGFMGKLPYTAPEVFSGSEASPQSDLYACAVMLYEALSGQNPFRAETQAATLQRVLHHNPGPLAGLLPEAPPGLDRVLKRALAKNPGLRHATAHDFAQELRRLLVSRESEMRSELAELLKHDFGDEMAQLLKLESLADRDIAWRKFDASEVSATQTGSAAVRRSQLQVNTEQETALVPQTPAPIGITVARASMRRTHAEHDETAAVALPPTAAELKPAVPPANTNASEPSAPPAAAKSMGAAAKWIFLGAVAISSAAAGVWLRPPPPAPPVVKVSPAPPIAVVSPPPPPVVTTPEPVQPDPVVEPVEPTLATTKPTVSERPRTRPRERGAPSASELTRALRKQQPKLQACFQEHSLAVAGQPTTQLEFDLAADGTLTRVELSPRALGSTSLGQCLLRVARRTPFPPQPRAVSFTIPLTASTTPGG